MAPASGSHRCHVCVPHWPGDCADIPAVARHSIGRGSEHQLVVAAGRLADVMTVVVIIGCIFFLVRRLTQPEVKFVTSASDFVILSIVAAPFITGFLAYHQWIDYPVMMVLHVVAGEVMLVAIPFTRLSHMLLSPFTRAYMGSEFGKVRHARDW